MFPELIKDLIHQLYVWLASVFSIDQDIIQIYNNKDVKLFSKIFIYIALKTGQSIGQSEKIT